MKVLVAGAGGFIGGHLVKDLLLRGHQVRAVDIKLFHKWFQFHEAAENMQLDLRRRRSCNRAVQGIDWVYNLAADMGGMGFIENNKALCMLSVLINTNLLQASLTAGVSRYFYASSACVYAAGRQTSADSPPLAESDAYPAMPEDGYGWEKLFSERMCRHFTEDFGLETRVARFHNVYGPHGTYDGGREKAPAAICRKVIEALRSGSGEIEIWGDGTRTRSFMFISDCLYGIKLIMEGECRSPCNLGSNHKVTINELVSIVEVIAGVKLRRIYDLNAPQGVHGRNSDNTWIRRFYGWEPSVPLTVGMKETFDWINKVMRRQ